MSHAYGRLTDASCNKFNDYNAICKRTVGVFNFSQPPERLLPTIVAGNERYIVSVIYDRPTLFLALYCHSLYISELRARR